MSTAQTSQTSIKIYLHRFGFSSVSDFAIELANKYPSLENVPLWLAAILTGFASVGFAWAFRAAEHFSIGLQSSHWFILIAPCCFVLSWFLVFKFAPESKGSGIPQVMSAISLVDGKSDHRAAITKLVGFRTMAIKILSALICVVGAGAIGREGPTIQIAAGIFFILHVPFQRVFPRLDAESWLIAGGAAGIAAAFNTPLGGLVYAIEELATKHFNQFRTTVIAAVMVSGLAALWLNGNYLYFNAPPQQPSTALDSVYAIIVGTFYGLSGGLFGIALYWAGGLQKSLKKFWMKALFAASCGLLIVLIIYTVQPEAAGPGKDLISGYLDAKMNADWSLTISRWLSPVISYAAGGAGGIFAPSLAVGASIGSLASQIFHSNQIEFFIVMGMIGFLTGITHAPFTSMVLVLEMTDRHRMIFSMMLATFSSFVVTRFVRHSSFYEKVRDDYTRAFNKSMDQASLASANLPDRPK